MSYENWETSIKPKVIGARNLHECLGDTPLDFFILTSSTSGTLGTPGQSNYAAGNSYLDLLARHRSKLGKPTTSIVLPMVLGVGYVAEHPEIEAALKRKGIYGIEEDHLLEAFEAAMRPRSRDEAIDHIIVGLDPAELSKSIQASETTDGFWIEDTRFRALLHTVASAGNTSQAEGAGASTISRIKSTSSMSEAVSYVSEHFTHKLSRLLLVDLSAFDNPTASIASYGLDSMIGAELRNWIFKEYQLDIPFQQLLGASYTIDKLAQQVCTHHK